MVHQEGTGYTERVHERKESTEYTERVQGTPLGYYVRQEGTECTERVQDTQRGYALLPLFYQFHLNTYYLPLTTLLHLQ